MSETEEFLGAVVSHPDGELDGGLELELFAFHHGAEDIGHDSAEHFEAGSVGEELAAVGDHAGEGTEQIDAADVLQLALHADGGIQKPPGGAEADFVSECAGQGGQRGILGGIQRVQNDFQAVVEAVEEADEVGGVVLDQGGDVSARVGSEGAEDGAADVADGAHVKLRDPALLRVHFAELAHHEVHVVGGFLCGDLPAGKGFLQSGVGHFAVADSGGRQFQTMVGGDAAHFREEVMGFRQDAEEGVQIADLGIVACAELLNVGGEAIGLDLHGLVGPPGGPDRHGAVQLFVDGDMGFQVVRGIVGGAHGGDVEPFEDGKGSEIGQGEEPFSFVPASQPAQKGPIPLMIDQTRMQLLMSQYLILIHQ